MVERQINHVNEKVIIRCPYRIPVPKYFQVLSHFFSSSYNVSVGFENVLGGRAGRDIGSINHHVLRKDYGCLG